MKKIVTFFLLLAMTLPITACNQSTERAESSSSVAQIQERPQTVSPTKLTNKMTENELAKVDKHGLTLLDAPEKSANSEDKSEQTAHTVSVEIAAPIDIEGMRQELEQIRDHMSDEEYEQALLQIEETAASEEGANTEPKFILVDGYIMPDHIPNADPDYDGGAFDFEIGFFDEDGEIVHETKSFTDFAEYLEWVREWDAENGYSDDEIEQDILRIQIANEALKTGDYETLPEGSVDVTDSSLHYVFPIHPPITEVNGNINVRQLRPYRIPLTRSAFTTKKWTRNSPCM